MISVIAHTISRLDGLRTDRELWGQCEYRETISEDRGSHDANELERHKFLIALQYNYTDCDEDLIRFLFDQEVVARQNDDFQGCGAIRLASYLLSRFKRSDDLWRFADAKLANFDTACGYDSQFLLSAGLETALDTFANGEVSRKEDIREYLFDENGECSHTEEELTVWESHLDAAFPNTIANEDKRVWIDRAIEFQCHEEGLALLDDWEKDATDEPLSSLKFLRRAFGDIQGAIACQRKILQEASDVWDKVSAAHALAELYVENQQPSEGWRVIEQHDDDLDRIDDWQQVGLGRMLVKTAFDIAKAPLHSHSQAAFSWACERGDALDGTTLEILTTAAQAAERVGDEERAKTFRRAAVEEQERIDEMLGQ